eukprot:m.101756 g.101756  ORF g.101756 m.101756 type:complete len:71 (+) comp37142_c0_seq1:494-706(+)
MTWFVLFRPLQGVIKRLQIKPLDFFWRKSENTLLVFHCYRLLAVSTLSLAFPLGTAHARSVASLVAKNKI